VLSICSVALGGEDYYLATAASGRDHADGLVEAAGVWLGEGADRLGLRGTAEPPAVKFLFSGVDPLRGERLFDRADRRRIAAFDCTFSVPKSVSVLQAFSPDETVREQIRLGHEAAVVASLRYLEAQAAAVRLGGVDGRRVRRAEIVGVGFLHRLSRSGDPHLHTHVLVANLVPQASEGAARPLDATGLYLECRTAGALYETHLRYELTARLGVEWHPLQGRCWSDLKGLDRAVVRDFSQRSTQIAAAMASEGWQGAAARRAMAELTRPRKDTASSYEETIERARRRLWQAGVTETRLRDMCFRLSPPSLSPRTAEGWVDETLRQLPARTVDGTFTRRDVIRARCATAQDGRTVAGVEADAGALLADPRVLGRGERSSRLRGGPSGSIPLPQAEARYTSSEIAAAEQGVIRLVSSMETARAGSVTVLSYEPGGRFEALDSLSLAAAVWRREGCNVLAVAPGRWSAAGIESACGIESVVVPGLRRDGQTPGGATASDGALAGVPVGRRSVVVVAEAQTYGPEALNGVVSACWRSKASLVLLTPSRFLEQRELLLAASALGRGRLPAEAAPTARETAQRPPQRYDFASVEVRIVSSLSQVSREAVRCQVEHSGGAAADGSGRTIVVAGDEAVVASLRAAPDVAASVVHARDLRQTMTARTSERLHLIVIGQSSVLRQAAPSGSGVARSHILVAAGFEAASPEALGRAAEAACPRYLTTELGRPALTPAERQAWRVAAARIESYRRRWQVDDGRRAFGVGVPSRERSDGRLAELAVLRREAASVLERGRARQPHRREGPGGLRLGS